MPKAKGDISIKKREMSFQYIRKFKVQRKLKPRFKFFYFGKCQKFVQSY